jgi:hypothetical protein
MILWKIFQIVVFFSTLLLLHNNEAANGNSHAQALLAFLGAGFATALVVEVEFWVKQLLWRWRRRKIVPARDTSKKGSELPRLRIDDW